MFLTVKTHTVLNCRRYVSIVTTRIKNNRHANGTKYAPKINTTIPKHFNLNSIDSADSKELQFKIKQLEEFTRNLKWQIKIRDKNVIESKKEKQRYNNEANKTNSDIIKDTQSLIDETFASMNTGERKAQQLPKSVRSHKLESLLPNPILERIEDKDIVQIALIDKNNQDWNLIVKALYDSKEKLRNLPLSKKEMHTFISSIKGLTYENIELLDNMFLEGLPSDNHKINKLIYNCLFLNLSNLPLVDTQDNNSKFSNDLVINKMKTLLKRYDNYLANNEGSKNNMNNYILNCCIKYASKIKNFKEMEYFLSKFKNDYEVEPNKFNSTVIIQFYSKIGHFKNAWDVFDGMKYLSVKDSPDLATYNSVLQLCNKEKNYPKAVDLLSEMEEKGISPSIQTYSLLAKTLATSSSDSLSSEGKSESLRLLGWQYIHKLEDKFSINDLVDSPDDSGAYSVLVAMLALASYDGDLALARALYFKAISKQYQYKITKQLNKPSDKSTKQLWKTILNPELLNYLLLAYQRYIPNKMPLLMGYENGIKLRRNILNSVDYSIRRSEDYSAKMPMLPLIDLTEPWQILAESRAIWHFNLDFGNSIDISGISSDINFDMVKKLIVEKNLNFDEFVLQIFYLIGKIKKEHNMSNVLNPVTINTFASIAIKQGNDEREFLGRINEFTFQKNDLNDVLKRIYSNVTKTSQMLSDTSNTVEELATEDKQVVIADIDRDIKYLGKLTHRILLPSSGYELMMKAATKFNDLDLAQKVWKARGDYRKSDEFQKLSAKERIDKDQEFAKLMVDFFTNNKMYEDALKVILSSKHSIDWDYSMVKNLHKGLTVIEDYNSIKVLLDIVNRKTRLEIIDEKLQSLEL